MPTANGSDASTPIHERSSAPADVSEDSKQKRRRRLTVEETPDWLPAGWFVEDRVRASGVTAGSVDKYYCDPVSGRVFRSKKEVLYFLETGTKRKKSDSSDADTAAGESCSSHKKSTGVLKAPANFDFNDPPEKVTWVLTDSSDGGSWAPSMDGKKLAESTMREWASAFKFATYKKQSGFSLADSLKEKGEDS